jgi:pilus assembly protein CpaC
MKTITAALAITAGTLACVVWAEEMIQVDVQVVELNKSRMIKAGIDWQRLLEGAPGAGIPAGAEVIEQTPAPLGRFGAFQRGSIDAFLRMLQANNYGKLLAKPKLLAASGSQASFLVGGELPVVSQDTQGHTSVNWKEYGVKLTVKPERRNDRIRTHVRAEASTVDAGTAVTLPNGTYMPGMKTRWAETDVELAPRSTVTMAGLIQSQDVKVSTGLPLLSDIPLLGWLFRHTRTEMQETELVIFVTPDLVTPQAGAGGV